MEQVTFYINPRFLEVPKTWKIALTERSEGSHQIFSSLRCWKQTPKNWTLLMPIVCGFEMWISLWEPFVVIVSSPLGLPIYFPSSSCFPVIFFFRIKANMQFHTMEYLGVLCVLGWVCSPLLERVNTFNFVCVCVLGRHSRGLRPEMGWVLLSSLNYLAHGGVCEWAPTPDFTGDCRAECTVFMTMSPPLWCFHKV